MCTSISMGAIRKIKVDHQIWKHLCRYLFVYFSELQHFIAYVLLIGCFASVWFRGKLGTVSKSFPLIVMISFSHHDHMCLLCPARISRTFQFELVIKKQRVVIKIFRGLEQSVCPISLTSSFEDAFSSLQCFFLSLLYPIICRTKRDFV